MKSCSRNKLIFGHLNINSVRNKLDSWKNTIERNIDILLICETKIGVSVPSTQFNIETTNTWVPSRHLLYHS